MTVDTDKELTAALSGVDVRFIHLTYHTDNVIRKIKEIGLPDVYTVSLSHHAKPDHP